MTDSEFADLLRSKRTLTEAQVREQGFAHDKYDLTPDEWLETHNGVGVVGAGAH